MRWMLRLACSAYAVLQLSACHQGSLHESGDGSGDGPGNEPGEGALHGPLATRLIPGPGQPCPAPALGGASITSWGIPWGPPCAERVAERGAWVIDEIETFNAWLSDQDRTAKYCKMVASPSSFFRGTNHLFWHDLAGDARFAELGTDQTRIWLQGDMHTDNIGFYDDDKGLIVFDLNDFDEAVIADYQWDVWRFATSIVLLAQERGQQPEQRIDALVQAFAQAYLDMVTSYRGNDDEKNAMFTQASTYGALGKLLQTVAQQSSRQAMLDKWTILHHGTRVFDPASEDLALVDEHVAAAISAQLPSYIARTRGRLRRIPGYFTIKDMARRLDAGTGSLGTPRYYVLIEGETESQDDDRILDIKRQGEPSAYPHLSDAEHALLAAAAGNHAARVVAGHRALMADADDHLGWLMLPDGVYSVRERSPYKKALPGRALALPERLSELAEQWGMLLAGAHARSDRDHDGTHIGYSFDKQVAQLTRGREHAFVERVREVAREYAQQVQADYQAFAGYVAELGLCSQQ